MSNLKRYLSETEKGRFVSVCGSYSGRKPVRKLGSTKSLRIAMENRQITMIGQIVAGINSGNILLGKILVHH